MVLPRLQFQVLKPFEGSAAQQSASCCVCGPATQAQLNKPTGVCTDSSGNVYINDNGNFRLRKVATDGTISTVAGSGAGSSVIGATFGTMGDGGPATSVGFSIPIRCAADRAGSLYITANPATRDESVILYLTGLGAVSNAPQPGQPASLATLSPVLLAPQVSIGGVNTTPAFAGLTPGYIGLYQINVAIPAAVASGTLDVTVQSNNVTSNPAKLPVR